MNGNIILNDARERLASELHAYREPLPSSLCISPWLAMSLLQKSIRRGECEWALRAAATLLLIAPDRLWRRCIASAFEEIGVADLETVSLATAALAGRRYRATVGGEWKVASFIVERMAHSSKCRASDDLLLVADGHPRYTRARAELAAKSNADLIRITTGNAELPIRALSAWYGVGTHPRQSKHLSSRRGDPSAIFDGLCEAGYPHTTVEIAREGFRKLPEPLCPFVALLCPLALSSSTTSADDQLLPETTAGKVPGWAMDMYTREGRRALNTFLLSDCDIARWVVDHIRPSQRLNFLGTVVFRVEGGLVRRRLKWGIGDDLRRQADVECFGPVCSDATEALQLMRNDISLLNQERSNVG